MTSNISDVATKKTWLLHSASGACSGAMTRFFCQPFDVIKIRFQLQVEPLSNNSISKYKSIFQSVRLISKEEGFRALWKGHLPGQILSITYGLTQFAVFQKSLTYISVNTKELNPTPSVHFISGVLASTSATLTSYPFDVIRTRLVAQKSNQIYTSMTQVAVSIYKTEGVTAYYRGLFPTLLQNSLQGGFIFMFYNIFSKLFSTNTSINKSLTDATNNLNSDRYQDNLNSVKQFSSGFFAGVSSKILVYPLDIIKKRLQLQDFNHFRNGFGKKFICNGLLDCIRVTIKGETFFGLFKGLSPALLKAGCVTALNLTLYEQTFKILHPLVKNY